MKNFHRTDGEEKDGTNLYLWTLNNVSRKCNMRSTQRVVHNLFLWSDMIEKMKLNETRVWWVWNENGEHQSILRGGHSEQRKEHFPRCAQGGNRAQNEHASPGYDGESIWKIWRWKWLKICVNQRMIFNAILFLFRIIVSSFDCYIHSNN